MKNVRRKRFCEEYHLLGDGRKAAISAGYNERCAKGVASRLLTFADVKEYLAELRRRAVPIYEKRLEMDADYLKGILKPIMDANIGDYFTWDGQALTLKPFSELTREQLSAIESIKQGRNGIEFKLHGKSWSTDMIAKHLGFYEKDNEQKPGNTGVVILPSNGREPVNNEPFGE